MNHYVDGSILGEDPEDVSSPPLSASPCPADDTNESAAKAKEGKKKGGQKKGKKAAKLLPGMAEAQSYATAALRLISLEESCWEELIAARTLRYCTPLLEGPVAATRWNARQVSRQLNLASITLYTGTSCSSLWPTHVCQHDIISASDAHGMRHGAASVSFACVRTLRPLPLDALPYIHIMHNLPTSMITCTSDWS